MLSPRRLLLSLALVALATPLFAAQPGRPASRAPARTEPVITRLLFQDRETQSLRWVDVRGGVTPTFSAVGTVERFPKLDEQQGLVQMEEHRGWLLVGVRDDADGEHGSGWVLLTTGVEEEEHGDHSHWRYRGKPAVRDAKIDSEQGNPAHLYLYDGVFYLANDRKGGYTRIDPAAVRANGAVPFGFHAGGGGHITLAVANGMGYATWIDREGDHAGRVDITPIKPEGNREIGASIQLPSGGLHGATAAGGKVFFAPADGIFWLEASGPNETTEPRHISLGNDAETGRPRRTGSFAVHLDHVLFVTGSGSEAQLGLLDARETEPQLVTIKVPGGAGTKPVTPACVRTSRGKHYAFVFHDAGEADEEDEADERPAETLTIVDLDPNGDGKFTDAAVAKTITVGRSRVEGHSGHHAVAFDADARRAYFTNPGDGTITVFRLDRLEPWATFRVGGLPGAIIAVGGRASSH
jgi:hypothetical protein